MEPLPDRSSPSESRLEPTLVGAGYDFSDPNSSLAPYYTRVQPKSLVVLWWFGLEGLLFHSPARMHAMTPTVSLDVPARHEALLRRVLALAEELDHLALTAPPGTVFDACESAVVAGGRQVQTQMLQDAVARRIETAEKRGRRSASVRAEI